VDIVKEIEERPEHFAALMPSGGTQREYNNYSHTVTNVKSSSSRYMDKQL
jgi:hypothetical protein